MDWEKRKRCFNYSGVVQRDGTVIFGVPTAEELDDLIDEAEAQNQVDVVENLYIPEHKPDVEQINYVNLKVCLEDAWITNNGDKIIIKGILWQKISYTACTDKGDQPMHTVEKKFPFSHFIDIAELDIPAGTDLMNIIVLAPEDGFVQKLNSRHIFKNIIVRAFVILPEC